LAFQLFCTSWTPSWASLDPVMLTGRLGVKCGYADFKYVKCECYSDENPHFTHTCKLSLFFPYSNPNCPYIALPHLRSRAVDA